MQSHIQAPWRQGHSVWLHSVAYGCKTNPDRNKIGKSQQLKPRAKKKEIKQTPSSPPQTPAAVLSASDDPLRK